MSDLDVYEKQNFGNQSGIGKRPALLVIDLYNRAYAGGPGPKKFTLNIMTANGAFRCMTEGCCGKCWCLKVFRLD